MMLLVMQLVTLFALLCIAGANVAAFLSLRALRRELEADAKRRGEHLHNLRDWPMTRSR